MSIFLQPKAKRDSIVGLHNDSIKISITSPPIEGKANAHLILFLSKQFKTAKSNIIIEKGELSRYKQVVINQPKLIPDIILEILNQ